MKIKKNIRNMISIEKELEYLKFHYVIVGFVGKESEKVVDGVPIWLYANRNEYGSGTTPSRPFFRTALSKNDKKIKERIKDQGSLVLIGKKTGEQALKNLGLYVQGLIQDSIKNGGWKANAPSTIKLKGKNNPLIDSGSMIKSVSFEIRRR